MQFSPPPYAILARLYNQLLIKNYVYNKNIKEKQ